MKSRGVVAACLAAVALALGSPVTAGSALEPVRTSRGTERMPAAAEGYLAWSQVVNRVQHVFARAGSAAPFRVNPVGTHAATGGIDGSMLLYQEFKPRQNKSDLWLMDLATQERGNPIAPNTGAWEYWPDMDGNHYLFGRWFRSTGRDEVELLDVGALVSRTLAAVRGRRDVNPGQVAGDHAVWEKFAWNRDRFTDCEVYIHDIPFQTTERLANPGDRCQYAPSVSPDGTVYYARGPYACGRGVKIMAYPPGGPTTQIATLPRGTDLWSTYASVLSDNTTEVFLDPFRCRRPARQDIYKVTIPAPPEAMTSGELAPMTDYRAVGGSRLLRGAGAPRGQRTRFSELPTP
jgi:hypothetical protein